MDAVLLKGSVLKAIAHKNHTATVVATSLAIRVRLRHESDIVRTKNALIRDGEKIVDEDYSQFWEDLEKSGAGVIIYAQKDKGSDGRQETFKWHFSLKKVAEAMLTGQNITRSAQEPASQTEAPKAAAPMVKTIIRKGTAALASVPKQEKSQNERTVFIPLRPGFDLDFKVPSNLSKDEVETITRALSRAAL